MRRTIVVAALIAIALLAAGCGGDNSSEGTESTNASPSPSSAPTGAADGAFPVEIEHEYGTTEVRSAPQRVVSVGFTDQDALLAMGVEPIAVRDWYGDQPFATWPWAQAALGSARPTLLPSSDLNFEQIAALKPDLIVGVSSGMTDTEYATLSAIAPTIAQPKGYIAFGAPWDEATLEIGRSVGKAATAAKVVDDVRARLAAARAAHPAFEGATAAVAFMYQDQPGAYASQDSRSRLLRDLGFTIPARFDELAKDSFYFSVSNEQIALLDTDVVVWVVGSDADLATVAATPLRPSMRAYAQGREVVTNELLSGAFSFASPLSIPYLLDAVVPELALAVDGDPATVVPSAATLAGPAAG
jgi:iron complex transport system substrate-binding protein